MKETLNQYGVQIVHATPEMAGEIYETLEHPNWAPWLEASQATIAGRAKVFPEGQLLIKENGIMVASLSMNQIYWSGNPEDLPSWDQVAGDNSTDYSETYDSSGNTWVLMSMNVAPDSKGQQLPSKMIDYVKQLAAQAGIKYLIGSFRPSGYGSAKKEYNYQLPFWTYCKMTKPGTNKPIDPWLRSLSWSNMQLIQEDSKAMSVTVSLSEFEAYKANYNSDSWVEVSPGTWECQEVGTWEVGEDSATYQESNVWGIIPFKEF